MKQGLIDADCLCKQMWEGSGNDFPSIVQRGNIIRQQCEQPTLGLETLLQKSFALLLFLHSVSATPSFPLPPSLRTARFEVFALLKDIWHTRKKNCPQRLDSKMLPQTLPYTDSFSSVTSHFFYFLFNPVSPF